MSATILHFPRTIESERRLRIMGVTLDRVFPIQRSRNTLVEEAMIRAQQALNDLTDEEALDAMMAAFEQLDGLRA